MGTTRTATENLFSDAWRLVDSLPGSAGNGDGAEEQYDENEWEEEETEYITLDFTPHLTSASFQQLSSIQLLELLSSTPYARISSTIFAGAHVSLIGSELLLSHPPSSEVIGTTSHRIIFRPITLSASTTDNKSKGKGKDFKYLDTIASETGEKPKGKRGRPKGTTKTVMDQRRAIEGPPKEKKKRGPRKKSEGMAEGASVGGSKDAVMEDANEDGEDEDDENEERMVEEMMRKSG